MRNVLVTGAGGFIGSAIAAQLASEGKRVVGLFSSRGREVERHLAELGVMIEDGDVCDYERMKSIIATNEIETVFHLAAYAIVRISARDPVNTYRTNVMGTVSLLEACRSVGGVKSIVVASSDKAYGDHLELPYTEDHPLVPKNTYDTSKACMDMVARSYAKNYDMPIVVTRCSNVYGPGDLNLSRIVPNTIRRMFDGKPPLLYSDISQMEREFIFIDDVVNAYVLLAHLAPAASGEAYNIGGTGPTAIMDIVKMIAKEIGKEDTSPEIVERDSSFREIGRQYIDATKILAETGWKANISLEEGIRRTVKWYAGYFGQVS